MGPEREGAPGFGRALPRNAKRNAARSQAEGSAHVLNPSVLIIKMRYRRTGAQTSSI